MFRLWPKDDTKNPIGYLGYFTHTINKGLDKDGNPCDPWEFQCPRSTNWDPFPCNYLPVIGVDGKPLEEVVEHPDGTRTLEPRRTPVFNVPCWACDMRECIADIGIESADQITNYNLQRWLFGSGYVEFGQRVTGLLDPRGEKYHFPITYKGGVTARVPRDNGKGENLTYGPSNEQLTHLDLSLTPGAVLSKLLDLIERIPDCSDLAYGRWFRLEKKGGGRGAAGYSLEADPYPTAAGFDLTGLPYPNYATWGKGNEKYGRSGKRYSYEQVEAIGADPNSWWVKEMLNQGIPVLG